MGSLTFQFSLPDTNQLIPAFIPSFHHHHPLLPPQFRTCVYGARILFRTTAQMSLLAICHLIYIQIGNLEFPIQIGNIGN